MAPLFARNPRPFDYQIHPAEAADSHNENGWWWNRSRASATTGWASQGYPFEPIAVAPAIEEDKKMALPRSIPGDGVFAVVFIGSQSLPVISRYHFRQRSRAEEVMQGYAIRAMCGAVSLWCVTATVPGIGIEGAGIWLLCSLAAGLSNGLGRTVIMFYVLPLRLGTIAGLSLAMNAVIFALLAVLLDGLMIEDAIAAVIGWLALAGLASMATLYIGPDGTLRSLIPMGRQRAAR